MLHVKNYQNRLMCHKVIQKIKAACIFETRCSRIQSIVQYSVMLNRLMCALFQKCGLRNYFNSLSLSLRLFHVLS